MKYQVVRYLPDDLLKNRDYHGQVSTNWRKLNLHPELLTNCCNYRYPILFGGLLRPKLVVKTVFILVCLIYLCIHYYEQSKKIKQTQDETGKRLPDAIIIGSRKGGTRALLKFLELNPKIRAARSEVHFFDRYYKRGLSWYRNQMPDSGPGEVVVEKSPAYFVTKDAPERIKLMNSSIKLILILRNPVTRLVSDFSQLVANKIETSRMTPEEEEQLYQQSKLGFERYVLRPDGSVNEQRLAVKNSFYSLYLEKWMASFPTQQIHLVDGEKMIASPWTELERVERFLGLEPSIKYSDFVYNPIKGFFCIASNRSIYREEEDTNEPQLGGNKMKCLGKSKGRRHVTVEQELLEKLKLYYRPYNEYLYSLIGKKLNWL